MVNLHKAITIMTSVFWCMLLAGCIASIDESLPYTELPEITVATPFNLVASPSHPTAYLSSNKIPTGEKVQVIGTDKDAAWLLVLHDNLLGWMPSFYSRSNVGSLKPAIVVEPLSDKCTKYLDATFAPDETWVSNINGAAFVVGSIYRAQTAAPFEEAGLDIVIEGGGAAVTADYVHTPLTPSSAVVLFGFSVVGLQKESRIHFNLINPNNESLSFQAAFFSNDCPEELGHLPIGKTKVATAGQVAPPKDIMPIPTQRASTLTPTPVVIARENGRPSVSEENEDATLFYMEDFSDVEIGYLPEGWVGGEQLQVSEERGKRFITSFTGLGNRTPHKITVRDVSFPENFRFEWMFQQASGCDHTLKLGDFDIFVGMCGSGSSAIIYRFGGQEKVVSGGRIGQTITFAVEKKEQIVRFTVDDEEMFLVRTLDFKSPTSFTFSFETDFRLYQVAGTRLSVDTPSKTPTPRPSASEGDADTTLFYMEDFSDVEIGYLPEGWVGGEQLQVNEEREKRFLTSFTGLGNRTPHKITVRDVSFPENFRFEWIFQQSSGCDHTLKLGDLDIFVGMCGSGSSAVIYRFGDQEKVVNGGRIGQTIVFAVEKNKQIVRFTVDDEEIFLIRSSDFKSPSSFTFSFETDFRLYQVAGTRL